MALEINFTLSIPASITWRLNKDFPTEKGIQRLWMSRKISGPSGNKFQIKLSNTIFTFSNGRTTEISQIVLRNCRMRKVQLERVDLNVSNPGRSKNISADLQNVTLKRSGAKDCGCGITFDRNLFSASVTMEVKVKVANGERTKLKDDLYRHLMEELSNPYFADTTLEVGDAELKCHGFLLAARSKVLKACLMQAGFNESKSKRIKVHDMSVASVTELLKFIYTDSFDADEDNIYDLFFAAEKYDIPCLKKECEDILVEDLDVECAVDCFQIGYLCRSDRLMQKSTELIAENLDEVQETEGWKAMDAGTLRQVIQEVGKCQDTENLSALLKNIDLSTM